MATRVNITPGGPPAVAGVRTSRRDILGAVGFSGLAGVALAGFVRPDSAASSVPSSTPDTALLTACASFQAAHRDQVAEDAAPEWDDDRINAISDRWYHALQAVSDAPRPTTEIGRIALARAARVALADQVQDTVATREEILALAALDAMGRADA